MKRYLITLMLSVAALGADAQAIYRCGNSYSETPCPQARRVDVSDARTDDQRSQAEQLAAGDQQLADRMAAERQQREASERSAAPRSKPAKRVHVSRIRWFKP